MSVCGILSNVFDTFVVCNKKVRTILKRIKRNKTVGLNPWFYFVELTHSCLGLRHSQKQIRIVVCSYKACIINNTKYLMKILTKGKQTWSDSTAILNICVLK